MADSFSFKRGARLPVRVITITGNGLTNLDVIDSAKFVYRALVDSVPVEERREIAASVFDSDAMQVSVAFAALDVSVEGKYQWHIEVAVSGLLMYFPEKGFYTFSVTDNIEAL
jgi:hypothetical protein